MPAAGGYCHSVSEALCRAISALLDDAEVALEGEHIEGALERLQQAQTVLDVARQADHQNYSARLDALNKRIEQLAQEGIELADEAFENQSNPCPSEAV